MIISSKFNIKDIVYYMSGSNIVSGKIASIEVSISTHNTTLLYGVRLGGIPFLPLHIFPESRLFKSKESLIASL